MTLPLFLADLDFAEEVAAGRIVAVRGTEGHHAAQVKRIRVGEEVLVADGCGQAIRGPVVAVTKVGIDVQVLEKLSQPWDKPRIGVVQALAKGDRSELAVQMLTELGVAEILPWSAERSIVKWSGDRGKKSLAKWRATAREATKQSRQFRVPMIGDLVDTPGLLARLRDKPIFVLHEEAEDWLVEVAAGQDFTEAWLIIGPEGGISPAEVAAFAGVGAQVVRIADSVLRTSTAGVVGVTQLRAVR